MQSKKAAMATNPKLGTELINLKELRDQILGRRCSNGKLFMFGTAQSDRLGSYIEELEKQKENEKNLSQEDKLTQE